MEPNPLIEWLSNVDSRIIWVIAIITLLGLICGAISFFTHIFMLFIWLRKQVRHLIWLLFSKKKLDSVAISLENSINIVLDDYTYGLYTPFNKFVKVKSYQSKDKFNIDNCLSENEKLIIPLSNDEPYEKCVARATYTFTKDNLFVKEKNYTNESMSKAIELFFSKKIIYRIRNQQAMTELYKLFSIDSNFPVENIWFDKISQIGSNYQYDSVFFSELYLIVDYFFPSTPNPQHALEIEKIAEFIYKLSTTDKGGRSGLDYSSKFFRVDLIIVGEKEKRKAFGIAPYDVALRYSIKKNPDRIYLIGGGFLNANAAKALTTFYKLNGSVDVIFEKETTNKNYIACLKSTGKLISSYFKKKEQIVMESLYSVCKEFSKGQISINGIYWLENESKVYISVYSIDKNINPVSAVIGKNAEILYKLQDKLNDMKVTIVKYDEEDLEGSVIEAFCVRDQGKEKKGIVSIIYNESEKKIKIKVSDRETARMLVGHNGIRVKIAQKLLNTSIDIVCNND